LRAIPPAPNINTNFSPQGVGGGGIIGCDNDGHDGGGRYDDDGDSDNDDGCGRYVDGYKSGDRRRRRRRADSTTTAATTTAMTTVATTVRRRRRHEDGRTTLPLVTDSMTMTTEAAAAR
jgi:hypothetical protein